MTDFIPYEYRVKRSTLMPSQGGGSGIGERPQIVFDSIIVPLSLTIDLSTIAGAGVVGTAGTTYEREYFLYHQLDYAAQAIVISTDEDTAQSVFTIQLTTDALDLSEESHFEILPKEPERIPVTVIGDAGAVYLRVRSTYQATQLYVTIELLTTKVP